MICLKTAELYEVVIPDGIIPTYPQFIKDDNIIF